MASTVAVTVNPQNFPPIVSAGANQIITLPTSTVVLIGTATGSAKLQVKGSGTTSATTAFLVQNANATSSLQVTDDCNLTIGTFSSGLGKLIITCNPTYGSKVVMLNNFGGPIITQTSTDSLYFGGQYISGLYATGYIPFVAPCITGNTPQGASSGSNWNFQVGGSPYGQSPSTPSRGMLFSGGFGFQSGGYANYFELSPTYTFDVSNGRIVKGIYYNPTLTTPNTNDKHYGIQTTSGGVYINTTTPNDSACLQADSTTQGFLPPRNNTTSNISAPAQGLQTYITASSTEGIYYYNSGSYQGWTRVLNNSGSQSITG
jgi:hypothetical protein